MRPPEALRIGRPRRPACTTCGSTLAFLVIDGDDRFCKEHDPLALLRGRMKAYRGGPFTAEWGALVDEEQDILRRRGIDIFGRPQRWSDRVTAARGGAQ